MTMPSDSGDFGPPVVEAIDVHHHYGEGPQRADVLFDINMQVREGELVIVTGPSGSGKTTLLTILGTMRRPSEGKLRLLGTDIGGVSGPALDVHCVVGSLVEPVDLAHLPDDHEFVAVRSDGPVIIEAVGELDVAADHVRRLHIMRVTLL